jgi:hypothetical protein
MKYTRIGNFLIKKLPREVADIGGIDATSGRFIFLFAILFIGKVLNKAFSRIII